MDDWQKNGVPDEIKNAHPDLAAELNGQQSAEPAITPEMNARFAVAFHENKVELALSGNNLFDVQAKQHVFGDIIGRLVKAEVRLRF